MTTNIADVLRQRAIASGDRVAIVHGRTTVTFAGLDAAADRVAGRLSAAGLRAGDRALLFCPISAQLYATVIGMFRLGVTAVFVDPGAGRSHLAACCERVQPRAFVATWRAHLLRLVSRPIRCIPIKIVIPQSFQANGSSPGPAGPLPAVPVAVPSGPALITFTSGSTGLPKAIARTHEFLLAQHRVLQIELGLRPGDSDLATLPIFVLANLASGVTSVIPDVPLRLPGTTDPDLLMRQIRTHRPATTAASPVLLERLASHCAARDVQLPMRRISTGGAPVFPVVFDRLSDVAPAAEIEAVYGSSEAEPIARLRHRDLGAGDRRAMRCGKGLLAGTPVASIQLRIIADRWGTPLGPCDARTFDAQALAPGTCGEVIVSGAHVLDSYLDGTGDDETKIRVGHTVWHRTGDAGYIDGAGRLWLLGRCSARVSDARGTLYPLAVEAAASEVAGVRRSAFAACRGRRVLVVETDPAAASPETIEAVLRRELIWAALDDVVVVGRIPVDARHNAKVDYPALDRLLRRLRIGAPATRRRISGSFPLPTPPVRAWRRYARRWPARVRR